MTYAQGELDGLCGLYGLINFIVREQILPDGKYEQGREAFRYMMESAENCGHLTAHRLHDGFEWPLLVEIFNDWASRYFHPYEAVPLGAVTMLLAEQSKTPPATKSVVGRIIKEGGAALLSINNGKHWILAVDLNKQGKFVSADPNRNNPAAPRSKFDDLECGIALVPHGDFLKAINAQKN